MHLQRTKTSCVAIALVAVSVLLFAAPQLARAQYTETVLYSFGSQSGDGTQPSAGVIMDKTGDLYGTTVLGGDLSCNYPVGCGTVFKLVPAGGNWTESVVYTFGTQSGDGFNPQGGSLVMSGTKLYGTTYIGGDLECFSPHGCGTVFEVTTAGTENVLYSFTSYTDGLGAIGVIREAGVLYGMTAYGGSGQCGNAFTLVPPAKKGGSWTKTELYDFEVGAGGDACVPGPDPIYKDGILYGTSSQGGANGNGTVFSLSATAPGPDTILYSFMGPPGDGWAPVGGPIMDSEGNIYGTTEYGGAYGSPGEATGGTVFELSAAGKETPLFSFGGYSGDGLLPKAGLIMYKNNLYGTTYMGGANGNGTVFELLRPAKKGGAWTEKILYSFGANSGDGRYPEAGLIVDKTGNLYGTTTAGGAYGSGTVFEITP